MKLKKVISILAVLLWMTVIYMFSAQEASVSASQSGGIVKAIESVVKKVLGDDFVFQKDTVFPIEKLIRKTAHFSIYAILGMLVFNCFNVFGAKRKKIFSMAVCFLYAVSDEVHQVFVPGRSGQISDVILDFVGGVFGICILILISHLVKYRRKT